MYIDADTWVHQLNISFLVLVTVMESQIRAGFKEPGTFMNNCLVRSFHTIFYYSKSQEICIIG